MPTSEHPETDTAPAVVSPSPVPCPRSLRVVRVDAYRLDARVGDVLLAYALQDAYGWVVLARRDRRIVRMTRVDGHERWAEWAVCARLNSVVHGELGGSR